MAYLNFPPVRPCRAVLPPGARWLDSLDYGDLGFVIGRPQDTLVYDDRDLLAYFYPRLRQYITVSLPDAWAVRPRGG
jgi:hypothetical protein